MTYRDCIATVIEFGCGLLPATRCQPEAGHHEGDFEAEFIRALEEGWRRD